MATPGVYRVAAFWCCLLLVRSAVSVASGVRCTSVSRRGECVPTQPPPTGCSADDGANCAAQSQEDPAALYNPRYGVEPLACPSPNVLPKTASPSHTVARDLTIILYPLGHKKYSLYVSWKASHDPNTTGFYIWTYKCSHSECPLGNHSLPSYIRHQHECLPIHSANARHVLYDGARHQTSILQCKDGRSYSPPRCNSSAIMTVVILPAPLPDEASFFEYLSASTISIRWTNLDKCWATAYNANCSAPVFIRPVSNFTVTTSGGALAGFMNIHVTWTPSAANVEYIVTVTDSLINAVPNCTSPGRNPPCFVARDTTHVTISMLNATREYNISVQVVPRCNDSSFAEHYVGCRAECCEGKRIRHIAANVSRPLTPLLTAAPHVNIRPSYLYTDNSATFTKSVSDIRAARTKDVKQPQRSSSIAVGSTNTPKPDATASHEKQNSVTRNGFKNHAPVIGVAIALLVLIFVATSVLSAYYFMKRRTRYQGSSVTSSSLSSSVESSVEEEEEGGAYRNMVISHVGEPLSYTVTCRENGANVLSEGSVISEDSDSTFEIGSQVAETVSTCSEKSDSSSLCSGLDEDAFEMPEKTSGLSPEADFEGVERTAVCAQREAVENGIISERRSTSVRAKKSGGPASKRRPRSFSTPHALSDSAQPLSALILYSKRSSEEEQKIIRQILVNDLTHYYIRTISEDTCSFRECPASWLEMQIKEVAAVFCVCNFAFDQEWENEADGILGMVPVFKQLCHGLVTPSCGKNQLLWDKIAIVLPEPSDLQYVPMYLNSRPKFRLLSKDLEMMARFATGMPTYTVESSGK